MEVEMLTAHTRWQPQPWEGDDWTQAALELGPKELWTNSFSCSCDRSRSMPGLGQLGGREASCSNHLTNNRSAANTCNFLRGQKNRPALKKCWEVEFGEDGSVLWRSKPSCCRPSWPRVRPCSEACHALHQCCTAFLQIFYQIQGVEAIGRLNWLAQNPNCTHEESVLWKFNVRSLLEALFWCGMDP